MHRLGLGGMRAFVYACVYCVCVCLGMCWARFCLLTRRTHAWVVRAGESGAGRSANKLHVPALASDQQGGPPGATGVLFLSLLGVCVCVCVFWREPEL